MNDVYIIELGSRAIILALTIAAPVLVAAMLMGLIVSVFQAATQINEQTLSFIPKIVAMTIALVISGPWILDLMSSFTMDVFNLIPQVTK